VSISNDQGQASPVPAARPRRHARAESMGAALLDRTHAALRQYVRFPSPEAADAWALLTVATHGQPVWEHATRGVIQSLVKGSGKSRLVIVSRYLAHGSRVAATVSPAWISRTLNPSDPFTIFIEEADRIYANPYKSDQTELLTAILNNGFDRGNEYLRWNMLKDCEESFPTFCMAVLVTKGIGVLPDTVTDRAIVITMVKARDGEVKRFRRKPDYLGPLESLREDIHSWIMPQLPALGDKEPEIPVDDRAAEKWEPLIIVADAAGGKWPERARRAAELMEANAASLESMPRDVLILSDIRDTIGRAPFIKTAQLIGSLRDIPESPWGDERLSPEKLATMLRKHGIAPGRDVTGTVRGYRLADLAPAFAAHLSDRPEPVSGTGGASEPVRTRQSAGQSVSRLTGSDGLTDSDSQPVRSISPGQNPNGRVLTGSDGVGVSVPARAGLSGPQSPGRVRRDRRGRDARGARQDGSRGRAGGDRL
jgi:Protein of unknown function (DUF3631)